MITPRLDVLPPAQRQLWPQLAPAAELGFVLYGGTAIALRLGHRQSVDFDFFSDRVLDRAKLDETFAFLGGSKVLQDEPNALTVLVPGQDRPVKVSFFGGLRLGRIATPETTNDGVLQVAAIGDLMAHKLKVILQRAEAKDYQDLAAMIRAGARLDHGLAAARRLFGDAFQPSESLKALVYFQEGDLHLLDKTDRKTLVAAAATVRALPDVGLASRELSFAALSWNADERDRRQEIQALQDTDVLENRAVMMRRAAEAPANTVRRAQASIMARELGAEARRRGLLRLPDQPRPSRRRRDRDDQSL